MARPSSFTPKKAVVTRFLQLIRHTSIVTSRHSFMIAVTVRVNNNCPAFFKLVVIYSWLPNNCLCIERCSSQQYEKNAFNI